MTLSTALLLLVAGFAAGIVNSLAGGGSFLTLTALVVAGGLPVDVANGTNRVAIVVQSLAAAWTFQRAGQTESLLVLRLAPATIVGAL
ncbi:MAG TPA: sulfite exporter TauE/SafE family protein, partial [Deltaproteobacteria bacterium]|nr:sulfite exporter TauE/SafE family protein [Deltaproteobacteria bacterium]